MTAIQVYEQAIKPLSADEKLAIARLIINEVIPAPVPEAQEEYGFEYLKRILPQIELITITDEDLASVKLNGSRYEPSTSAGREYESGGCNSAPEPQAQPDNRERSRLAGRRF